jgi:hypothetical protein
MMKSAHQHADHDPMVHHIGMGHGNVGNGHAAMAADFRNRFWVGERRGQVMEGIFPAPL